VNKNPEELSYYGGMLQEMRCQVRTSSSFAKGAQCLERERHDLIVLDQGSSRFEGRQLLMAAMEVDTEVPVLVLARSYDTGCCEEAMQSGAMDYVEGPLSEAEIVAFLETYVPRRSGSPRSAANRSNGPIRAEKNERKARFRQLQVARCVPVTSGENMAL
jgi:DNA-binding NtrC family response regulator